MNIHISIKLVTGGTFHPDTILMLALYAWRLPTPHNASLLARLSTSTQQPGYLMQLKVVSHPSGVMPSARVTGLFNTPRHLPGFPLMKGVTVGPGNFTVSETPPADKTELQPL